MLNLPLPTRCSVFINERCTAKDGRLKRGTGSKAEELEHFCAHQRIFLFAPTHARERIK